VMGIEALHNPMMRGHLVGDVPALFVIAAVLGILMRNFETREAVCLA